jgi:hypothetical protein
MCLVGWEPPRRSALPDRLRRFETLWTVDPRAVRTAARLAAHHVETQLPTDRIDRLARRLSDQPTPPSPDLERVTALFQRMVGYVDAADQGF